MDVGEAAYCAGEAVGSSTACRVDGQVVLGPAKTRRSPALGPLVGLWSRLVSDSLVTRGARARRWRASRMGYEGVEAQDLCRCSVGAGSASVCLHEYSDLLALCFVYEMEFVRAWHYMQSSGGVRDLFMC